MGQIRNSVRAATTRPITFLPASNTLRISQVNVDCDSWAIQTVCVCKSSLLQWRRPDPAFREVNYEPFCCSHPYRVDNPCTRTSTRLPEASRIGGSSPSSDARSSSRSFVIGSNSPSEGGRASVTRPSSTEAIAVLRAFCSRSRCSFLNSVLDSLLSSARGFGDRGNEIVQFIRLQLGRGQDCHRIINQTIDGNSPNCRFC